MPSAGPDHADDEDPGTRPRRRGKAPGADYVLHCVRTGPERGQVSAQIRSQHAENPQVSVTSQPQTRDRGPSRVIPAQALLTSRSRRPCSALIRAATAATAASLRWSQTTATPW